MQQQSSAEETIYTTCNTVLSIITAKQRVFNITSEVRCSSCFGIKLYEVFISKCLLVTLNQTLLAILNIATFGGNESKVC